jgi:hypothetical protein
LFYPSHEKLAEQNPSNWSERGKETEINGGEKKMQDKIGVLKEAWFVLFRNVVAKHNLTLQSS